MQLRLSLHSLKKGADSMSSYLLKAKSISYDLSLASKPVSDDDMVLYILGGLSSEYASLVTSITTRVAPISVADLHGFLLNEEIRIQSSVTSDLVSATANMALTSCPSDNMNRDSRNYSRGRGRGFSGRRGRHRGRAPFVPHQYQYQYSSHFNNGNRASSQPFYSRSDSTYTGPTYNDPYNHFANQSQAQYAAQPQAHIASQYAGPSFLPPSPGFSGPHSPPPTITEWHPDTGATDHITPDLNSLQSSSPYGGSDSVRVGNVSGLKIEHIGYSHACHPYRPFLLSNILHVPQINTNLLSVRRFALNNDVFFEFHPFCFFVKDRSSGRTLLRGPLKNGLYHMALNFSFSNKLALTGVRASQID
ncbi:UBN2 domain-containing protein [Cephalotus follicularis]|uniref:UBN2 domain-containing protein n=1 Tax=Cephalotus follicularis TaxID=3775 RepID=A0A1Q3D242_CEPFO|nr:UBN2 domain-containing protein [Cephalotus follicularis]